MVVTGRDRSAATRWWPRSPPRRHGVLRRRRPRRRSAATTQLVETAAERLGGLTVLVNNAAGGDARRRTGRRPHDRGWDAILRVDLTAPMWCARAAIPHMQRAGHGSIVNISSRQAERASRGFAAYVAAKSGLNGLTRAIAVDYADDGIRCNTVSPGYVLNDRRDADITPERRARSKACTSPGSASRPTSPTRCVYLASRESEFVTGINLQLDGGSSIARGLHARLRSTMHPRACVSAISTFSLSLAEDLAFWAAARHRHASACRSRSSKRFGWDDGTAARRRRGRARAARREPHRARPVRPRRPDAAGRSSRTGSCTRIDTAAAVGAECMVFTTGPFAPLTWEEAADALEAGARAGARRRRRRAASRSRSSTRTRCASTSGFVHTLQDAIDLAAPARHRACAWS